MRMDSLMASDGSIVDAAVMLHKSLSASTDNRIAAKIRMMCKTDNSDNQFEAFKVVW